MAQRGGSEKQIGQILLKAELITQQQLEAALKEQHQTGELLYSTVVRLGFATASELYPTLADRLGIPYVDLSRSSIDPKAVERVSARSATYFRIMPIEIKEGVLTVAMADPLNLLALDELRLMLGLVEVKAVLATEADILKTIQKYYGLGAETVEGILEGRGDALETPHYSRGTVENLEQMAEDASVMKLVNQLLVEAVQERATDLHLEPYQNDIRVRFRIDGVLYDVATPANLKHFHSAVVSRVKVMSHMDIAEHRLPQDGRLRVKVQGKELDLRVSVLPSVFGESVHLRILSSTSLLTLERLGLLNKDLEVLNRAILKPHGIILVTGPTGSGKTTTLYACLSKINRPSNKILTIEDPVEYEIHGVTQMQVHPKISFKFSDGLRSMLRHDPDVMMIGEIRDYETAEISIRAALTGHLVFSTLHTNDAAGAITRLIDLGVEPFLVASSVVCLIAQRLVRVICSDCKEPVSQEAKIEALKQFGVSANQGSVEIYQGKGCPACKMTGFRGRTAIYEFLKVNDAIRDLILKNTASTEISRKAVSLGMRTLRDDGWEKIQQGVTTVDEILRVTSQEGEIDE